MSVNAIRKDTRDKVRADALADFRAHGLPTRRIEDWKYSDLKSALGDVPDVSALSLTHGSPADGIERFDLASLDDAPDWVSKHFGAALTQGETMASASLGFAPGGVALRVPRGMASSITLDVGAQGQARLLLVVEDGASVTLIERNAVVNGFRNLGGEIFIAANASVTHVRVSPAHDAVSIADMTVVAGRDARYTFYAADLGGKLSRHNVRLLLNGANAEADLSGALMLRGRHADVTTHIDHAVANTASRQLFKIAGSGRARGVYQGRITVRAGADGSDSSQTAKALLLGSRAEADLKPELEIFADDVKCAHGAAVGDLDPDSLFYLRARGIPEDVARGMLIRAFLEEAVERIEDGDIRAAVWALIEPELAAAMRDAS